MAALLIRLKLRLLAGSLRGSLSQRIGLVTAALVGLGAAAGGTAALIALRFVEAGAARAAVVVGGSLLVAGWGVVPVLVSGVDETLDPSRFALLPLRAARLVPGLLLAGLVGVPGAVTLVLGLASVVTWTRGPLAAAVAVPSAAVGVLTCLLAARLTTTAGARLLAGRRFRELGGVIAVLALASVGIWPTVVANGGTPSRDGVERFVDVLGWTPLGLAWAAPADVAAGRAGRGLLRLLLAAVLAVVGAWAWSRLLDHALTSRADAGGGGPARTRTGRSVLDRLPAGGRWGPAWAVAARSLRYWRRDPRYLVAFGAVCVSGVVPAIAIRSSGAGVVVAGLGPFLGMFLGLVTSNDVGTDGSAFAAHLAASVRGRDDRLGRAVAALAIGVPVVTAATVVGVLVAGQGRLWPGALGAGLGALFAGIGASAVASALAAFPVPEAGGNPFRGTSGGGARAALAQAAVMGVTGTVAFPSLALLLAGALRWYPAVWLALLAGPALGLLALAGGIVLGGRVVDDRGPEILATVRRPT